MQRIHTLAGVKVFRIAAGDLEWIGITADGTSPSSGWRNPALSPWLYTEMPTDKVQDFDFYADEPLRATHGPHPHITADQLIERSRIDYWGSGNDLAGVRIHSRRNMLEARFSGSEPVDPATLPPHVPTIDAPWAWATGQGHDLAHEPGSGRPTVATRSLASVIGTRLLIIEDGDGVHPAPAADRTTIRINRASRVIENIWID